MGKYGWRNDYGFDETLVKAYWLSIVGDASISLGNTTREKPGYSQGATAAPGSGNYVVFSSGVHTGSMATQNAGTTRYLYGQGMNSTVWQKSMGSAGQVTVFYGMRFEQPVLAITGSCSCYDCDINAFINSTADFHRSKIRMLPTTINTSDALSIIGVTLSVSKIAVSSLLYENCNISIGSQAEVNLSTTRYAAFNNCKFKIGAETDYTALTGSTASELRASLVTRCVAAGYTVPSVTEYGETLQAGRWVLSNNSSIDGLVLKDSEIYAFEVTRLLYFGFSSLRSNTIPIVTDKTKPGSFSPTFADTSLLNVINGAIQFKPTTDISTKINTYAKSNIIWLGGKYQLNLIDIVHNLPKEYGIFLDSTLSLSDTSTTVIEAGKTYYLRSSNSGIASITYNGVSYDSALINNKHVFIGVSGVTSFTDNNGNAVVREVLDNQALHQTILMRIVNSIPSGNIVSGTALTDGYWYLVEHDTDQSNTTDYVTYGGANYPVGGSFLASGTGTFTKSGNVHLRRCWKDTFNYDTETLDKTFWASEQKPKWFDVLPNYLYCLMKYNNGLNNEMQTDANGNYITSGSPSFFDMVYGTEGVKVPSFPIKGTYMQLQLIITSQNPM